MRFKTQHTLHTLALPSLTHYTAHTNSDSEFDVQSKYEMHGERRKAIDSKTVKKKVSKKTQSHYSKLAYSEAMEPAFIAGAAGAGTVPLPLPLLLPPLLLLVVVVPLPLVAEVVVGVVAAPPLPFAAALAPLTLLPAAAEAAVGLGFVGLAVLCAAAVRA